MSQTHTNAGVSVYDQRPDCPAPYHDSCSATRRVGCICPAAVRQRRTYLRLQDAGLLESPYIDVTGTRRRIQALAAIGYPTREIARRIGRASNFGTMLWGDGRVHRNVAGQVLAAYEQLSGTPGPSQRARRAAAAAGWVPPLAWDDETIDDPHAQPDLGGPGNDVVDEVAIRRALDGAMPFGQLRRMEKVALFRDHGERYGVNELCRRLRISGATIRHWREQVAA